MRILLTTFALLPLITFAHNPEANHTNQMKPDAVLNAVSANSRSAKDKSRDEARKPIQILNFAGIKPDMQVLDIFSGGGYYVEILANLVGDNGQVFEHNNDAYMKFVAKEHSQRYQNKRLSNVTHLHQEANDLQFEDNSLDAITFMLAIHDMYYADSSFNWPLVDRASLFGKFKRALKENGVILIIDHHAATGSGGSVTQSLHRLEALSLQKEMESYGFKLVETSSLLENSSDDLKTSAVNPKLAGRTSRFVHKYIKI